jgi:ubiquitin carboxyl-terminal hydrolase 4/11/15
MLVTEGENSQPIHFLKFNRTIKKIDINDLNDIVKRDCNHGVCGSNNLGNTCFMNSSIACLSNCTELTTYFLSGQFKQNINKKNKLGVGGKLANAWGNLLEKYWKSNINAGNPSKIKEYVAKKVKKFSGFNQQDSNEFMTEFLSLLNEDLNKTTKKNYKELKEKGQEESELDCAISFWENHRARNDSIITDLFSGLLKSVVVCSNCGYNNITFDPFNTLTLPIPDFKYQKNLYNKRITHKDITLFYIPKYSIRNSCKIDIHILKDTPFKNMVQDINKIDTFKYNLQKLVFIKVESSFFEKFIDLNQCKNDEKEKEHIFAFDDLTIEGEKTQIIPLYMYNNKKQSSFPRLLFLKENMNFGELKKVIYYHARKYFKSPFKTIKVGNDEKKEIYNVEEELEKYKKIDDENNEQNEEESIKDTYDENKLWELLNKEYDEIFNRNDENNKEELEEFFNDFPYKITIKEGLHNSEEIVLFDGKNNIQNLEHFKIFKDEDSIFSLLENENENKFLNLVLKPSSKNSISKINLNSCVYHKGKDVGKKFTFKLTLDDLLEYFCSKEYLEKGNEWKCGDCKTLVNISKKFSIYYLPRLLIICLNRFSNNGGHYDKNEQFIDFPLENLDMEKYICENAPDRQYSKYDLFAVSQYYGSTEGGHYTAICKNIDGNWYNYNDSSVSHTSASSAVSSAAYVLFYRRKNW